MQRRKSADLLKVASQYRNFPILLETYRECLRDVFDIHGLTTILQDIGLLNANPVLSVLSFLLMLLVGTIMMAFLDYVSSAGTQPSLIGNVKTLNGGNQNLRGGSRFDGGDQTDSL